MNSTVQYIDHDILEGLILKEENAINPNFQGTIMNEY